MNLLEPGQTPEKSQWYKKIIPPGKERLAAFVGVGAVLVVAVALVFKFSAVLNQIVPKAEFALAYTLVQDKVSKSAPIVLNLPENITITEPAQAIKFDPEIKGSWQTAHSTKIAIFKPAKALEVGKYYNVRLATANGEIGKDFLADEDPAVEAFFPAAGSEAAEKTNITVVFNRPMVPVTTLQELDKAPVGVSIVPPTDGRYKWVGTHTLQFIPATRLIRSSQYRVKVNTDAKSLDGLPVKPAEAVFQSRLLRFASIDSGNHLYDEPLNIRFNQPVDLERTSKEISVAIGGQGIPLTFEYGITRVYNAAKKSYDSVPDHSVIAVYQKQDRHRRAKVWDFNSNYTLRIKQAFPEEGTQNLAEERTADFTVGEPIASIMAESDRASINNSFASLNFFDPEGRVVVSFYDEIDLEQSTINAPNLKKIGYGQKCADGSDPESQGPNEIPCEKIVDRTTAFLSFNAAKFTSGQKFGIEFKKIVTPEGFTVNPSPIIKQIRVFPALALTQTVPASNATQASVTSLTLCTSNPLQKPAKEDFGQVVQANAQVDFKSWGYSTYVEQEPVTGQTGCHVGEFSTSLYYGLVPNADYRLDLHLTDQFGQQQNATLKFHTEKIKPEYLNFYHFQKEYSVTPPTKTRLTYAAENMDFVDISICKVSPETMLTQLENKLSFSEGPGSVTGCLETAAKRLELPDRYWVKNYFTLDVKDYFIEPIGQYIITFAHPDYRERGEKKRQVFERSYLTVTNLGIVEKKVELWDSPGSSTWQKPLSMAEKQKLSNLYWVTNLSTLAPVTGATVGLFAGDPPTGNYDPNRVVSLHLAADAPTDEKGIARLAPVNYLYGAIVKFGSDSAFTQDVVNLASAENASQAEKMYVYTDRPIYRPGDTVKFKGLYRVGYDGSYEIFRDKKVIITVYDAAEKLLKTQDLSVNEFGTFNGEVLLDTAAPLGSYRIEVNNLGQNWFDVQEYTPAAFKIAVNTDKPEYVSRENVNLDVQADYYFGVPLDGGTVEYSIVSQDYYFDKYQGADFQFGNGWYSCYDECSYGDKFILRDSVELDLGGHAKITRNFDFEKLFPKPENRQSKIIVVYLTVKNKNGQSVSTQKSFLMHAGEFYLGLKADKTFLAKNQSTGVQLKSVDILGKDTAINEITLVYNKIKWLKNRRQEVDGGYYYTWEKKIEPVKTQTLKTNKQGLANASFVVASEGEYIIEASSRDARGNTVTSRSEVYVYGEGQIDVQPSNDTSLEVTPEKNAYQVGDTVAVVIKSPFPKGKALISLERGQVFQYQVVDVNQSIFRYEFKVTKDFIPNIFLSVVLIAPDPEVKYGQVRFSIDTKERNLKINVQSNKTEYLPGEEVTLTFAATDHAGAPVAAEFSAAVVDESVLALKGNPNKNPAAFFYDGFPLTVATYSNVKNILHQVDVALGTKGGGGGMPADLAGKKRGEFKDTAFWQAVIVTDKNGRAEVKFKLPDNLTSWQAEVVGLTKDTQVGAGYAQFTSKKEVMAVPLVPRFVVPGDSFMVGATIFNQTADRQKLQVKLESNTLTLVDKKTQKEIVLAAGQSKKIYFAVAAPEKLTEGQHKFTITAQNERYRDSVEGQSKIVRNETYETVATGGQSTADIVKEWLYAPGNIIPDRGEVTVRQSATLAVFLSDGVKYLADYSYGSAEAFGSKLRSLALIKQVSKIKNIGNQFAAIKEFDLDGKKYPLEQAVKVLLAELARRQNSDGGFTYYPGAGSYYSTTSNLYLSIALASDLRQAEIAGLPVDKTMLKNLQMYLGKQIQQLQFPYPPVVSGEKYYPGFAPSISALNASAISPPPAYKPSIDRDTLIMLAIAASDLKAYGPMDVSLVEQVRKLLGDKTYLQDQISHTSLLNLALLLKAEEKIFGSSALQNVLNILKNDLEIDSRGTHLGNAERIFWECYETPIKNTALLLKVFSVAKDNTPVTDRILRWLVAGRSADGSWGSTQNTVAVIDGFTSYLQWKNEGEANFTLATLFNDVEKSKFTFAGQTITAQKEFQLSVADLPKDTFSTIQFKKIGHAKRADTFYYDIAFRYFLPVSALPPRDEGFSIERSLYAQSDTEFSQPLSQGKVGDVLRVRQKIIIPKARNYVSINDYIPAGAQIVNTSLATEDQSLGSPAGGFASEEWMRYEPAEYSDLYPSQTETRDDHLHLMVEHLEPGVYVYDYYIRLLVPGKFNYLPATIAESYFPENFGRTSGTTFTVVE